MSDQAPQRLGWIGTGVMGLSMAGHLLDKGYPLTVYSRTKPKAQPLLDRGAAWADTPGDVARDCGIVFTMVGFPNDVREVYLGVHGLLEAARPGQVFVDMTTTSPTLAVEIAAVALTRGTTALDAPVTGGDVGARNATLSIMVGGDASAFGRVRPILEALGRTILHHGGPGSGQHAKLTNQIVIAGTMVGVCEALLYAAKAGLDLPRVVESISQGAAGCWTLDNLAPKMIAGDYRAGFFIEHFIKDMGLALDEARRMNLALPGLALVHQLYVATAAQGHARSGTQALIAAIQGLSNA